MRTQQIGPERAIQPDGKWFDMADGGPKCLNGMSRQIATGHIGDCHRYHQGHVPARCQRRFLRRHGCTFGVQRVENRFDQQEIHAAFDKRVALFAIDAFEIIKVDFAIAGVVDVWRQ